MIILEAGDTALVISQMLLDADKRDWEYSMDKGNICVLKKFKRRMALCN